uniref:medium-chain acyl-CoA ligase n=1 Tax=Arion vulgaris TaxID=1028688 RepID=A0A0B7AJP7_9EUPU
MTPIAQKHFIGICRLLGRSRKQFKLSPNYLFGCTWNRNIQLDLSGYNFTDYEIERKSYDLQAPKYFNFAHDFIDQWAHAEKVGLRTTSVPSFWWVDSQTKTEIKLSFQQLSHISKRVANALVGGCGLNRGDILILILPKIPEWWFINIACIRAGITLSPGTMLLRTTDIQHRLKLSQAKCIITSPELAHYVDEAANTCEKLTKVIVGGKTETRPGWLNFDALLEKSSDQFQNVRTKATDQMMLFFTSGTTGYPKMAEHTHASYGLGHIITARYWLMLNPSSIMWNLSDPGWAKCAWSSLFAPWINGACVFVYNSPRFDPMEVLQVLSKYPITHFCSSPTGLRLMKTEKISSIKFKALKHCTAAGEPVNPELIENWKRETGLEIFEGYGQTETTLVCNRSPSIPYKEGSMGKAVPGVNLYIVDDDGNVQEPCAEGNLAIKITPNRPIGLFAKYLNDPIRTAKSFLGNFYLTGDRGYMDQENYVYFVGRADDVISSAGYRIGPFEVESALLEHPAVLESAVVSSPDETRGEVVKAFVTLTQDYKNADRDKLVQELQNHVKAVTAPYKYPRKIEFVEDLPKTVSGKIRRVELRNKEWNKT